MPENAVIDRFVDGIHAVLFVGDDEREMVLPIDQLPAGAVPGVWLQVEVDGERVTAIAVDPAQTEARRRRIDDKLALLRQRSGRLRRDGEAEE
jgi:hypothetical protein